VLRVNHRDAENTQRPRRTIQVISEHPMCRLDGASRVPSENSSHQPLARSG
jgi:hypothetical protein